VEAVEPSLAGVPGVDNSQILLALTAVNSAPMSVADTLCGQNSDDDNDNDDDDESQSHVMDVRRALH
jgi:hypothetical protein